MYEYQPLAAAKNEIRLLKLYPGQFDDPIRASLMTVGLNKLLQGDWPGIEKWYALSYVWGPIGRENTIDIAQRKIAVTPTLERIIRYLRSSETEKFYWIDQICINQDDVVERSSQVQFMRSIYSQATQVIAWLGEDSRDGRNVLPWLHTAGRELQDSFENDSALKAIGRSDRSQGMVSLIRNWQANTSQADEAQVSAGILTHLRQLFENEWFERVWTLQESVLARELILQMGFERTSWDDVYQILRVPEISELDGTPSDHFRRRFWSIIQLCILVRDPKDNTAKSFRPQAMKSLDRAARDDKDYVYGQLGLLNARIFEYLKPDYTSTVEDVYAEGTLALIAADQNLTALGHCCAYRRNGRYRLPSWCPDWSDEDLRCGIDDDRMSINIDLYDTAPASSGPSISATSDGQTRIRGMIVDEVDVCVSGNQSDQTAVNLREPWALITNAFSLLRPDKNQADRSRAVCRALLNDSLDGKSRASAADILLALSWLRGLLDGTCSTKFWPGLFVDKDFPLDRLTHQLSDIGIGFRSLFETKAKRFGRSCAHVRPGDKICLLRGGRLPFILRSAQSPRFLNKDDNIVSSDAYQLIGGESFVNGLTYGEDSSLGREQEILLA